MYRKALANEPDGFGTRPPWPIEVAGFLATRGIRFEDVPDLVFAGFAATERRASRAAYTDLRGTPQDLEQDRNMFYLFGYMPLAEAYARLGRLDSAKDILLFLRVSSIWLPTGGLSGGLSIDRANEGYILSLSLLDYTDDVTAARDRPIAHP